MRLHLFRILQVFLVGLSLSTTSGSLIIALEGLAYAQQSSEGKPSPTLPRLDHIVIIIEENQGFQDIFSGECPPGSGSSCAPYFISLAKRGASLVQFFALHHPSQPNYIEFFSGTNHGIIGDCCPLEKCQPQEMCRTDCETPPSKPVLIRPSLAGLLIGKNTSIHEKERLTFGGFAEDLPEDNLACCSIEPGKYYARKHCPWLDFLDVPETNVDGSPTTLRFDPGFWRNQADIQRFAKLPTISFLIPNLINDMHSLPEHAPRKTWPQDHDPAVRKEILGKLVNQGDVWLQKYITDYVEYVMKEENNSLLIITWDEDSGGRGCKHPCPTLFPSNQIATIFVGAKVKSGYQSSVQYTHYNLLRTILDIYGLPLIGGSQNADPITDIWK